ncbi:MAG: FAD-binding oxidoreductase [Bacteroidetes bacterium]|nr:MAG: FAD-binding oxidoreductase [Bacteroidota bacterium]
MKVSNWGKYPVAEAQLLSYRPGKPLSEYTSWIGRGMGRCYGDSALAPMIVSGLQMNRFLAFDAEKGLLTCEAGTTYEEIIAHFLPRGWFPPVTPGTKYVSMGGALASDVHGKNHHVEGSFSRHVQWFDLLTATGTELRCSRAENAAVFYATAGGMGLTGFILRMCLQLKPVSSSFIHVESLKARNLEEILGMFDEFVTATYSVAWIDCLSGGSGLGRSILLKGEHAAISDMPAGKAALAVSQKKRITVPFDLPSFTLNSLSIRAFNALYYGKQFSPRSSALSDYDSYFYPLDVIHHWNRIYGRRGFTQYQFVVPKAAGKAGIREVLERVQKAGMGSFLSVLKLFGPEEEGWLSFPMEGYTLTLDFPISQKLFPFLDELDQVVAGYGGRVYLTKDVRLGEEMFRQMYPRQEAFYDLICQLDPEGHIYSQQADRLGLTKR